MYVLDGAIRIAVDQAVNMSGHTRRSRLGHCAVVFRNNDFKTLRQNRLVLQSVARHKSGEYRSNFKQAFPDQFFRYFRGGPSSVDALFLVFLPQNCNFSRMAD